jgi:16S rRNA processing protein RimM
MFGMADLTDEFLLIGQVVAPFGLRGQLKLRATTDRPDYIERHVRTLYLGRAHTPYKLRSMFEHKPGILVVTLAGVTTREQAEDLRRSEVFIQQRDAAPLAEGEYFLHQLYDLRVETEAGEEIGHVTEVLETGASEVLVVARPDQSDALIPMIRDIICELDFAGGRVVVRPLEGLL